MLLVGLTLTRELTGCRLPAPVESAAGRDRVVAVLVAQVCRRLFCGREDPVGFVERSLFQVHSRECARDRTARLAGLACGYLRGGLAAGRRTFAPGAGGSASARLSSLVRRRFRPPGRAALAAARRLPWLRCHPEAGRPAGRRP
jgi:hypothetical protein